MCRIEASTPLFEASKYIRGSPLPPPHHPLDGVCVWQMRFNLNRVLLTVMQELK